MESFCRKNGDEARKIYYRYTKEKPSELMNSIIKDTIPRLETDIKADVRQWLELYNFLEELGLVSLSDEQYEKIWETTGH